MKEQYIVHIIDEFGETKSLTFRAFEDFNLMELIEDKLWVEWGDCKGRAMCGTCHVEVIEGDAGSPESFEQDKINELPNRTANSRLACQVMTDKSIHNATIKILRDY